MAWCVAVTGLRTVQTESLQKPVCATELHADCLDSWQAGDVFKKLVMSKELMDSQKDQGSKALVPGPGHREIKRKWCNRNPSTYLDSRVLHLKELTCGTLNAASDKHSLKKKAKRVCVCAPPHTHTRTLSEEKEDADVAVWLSSQVRGPIWASCLGSITGYNRD